VGHLFVTRGDITKLACDAWLLPGDAAGYVNRAWHGGEDIVGLLENGRLPASLRARLRERRVLRLRAAEAGRPAVWFADTGGTEAHALGWYVEAIDQFVREEHPHTALRRRPLLAIPFIGSGAGGQDHARGGLLEELLPEADKLAGRVEKDVVFAAFDDPSFTAAQAVRRRNPALYWSELGEPLLGRARELADWAATGKLVVFFGAGVSTAAGLPDWPGLINQLASRVGLEEEFGQATDRLLDWAAVIEARFAARAATPAEGERQLRATIADIFRPASRSTLTHTLLASLPVREFVTMNYDQLFEQAAEAARSPVAVLPWQTTKGRERWLLKMHGSIDHHEEIVLTRADYLRYTSTRGALRGLVQALLITRHMLFVGFSLTDDNFYRIADDVRRAVRRDSANQEPFGTALALAPEPLTSALWANDLDIVALAGADDRDRTEAAWLLDVFLDYMLAQATTVSRHLLDPRFTQILTAQEKDLRDAVQALVQRLQEAGIDPAGWPPIEAMLENLGRPHPSQSSTR